MGAASLAYDANGNLIGDGAVTYRYDVQNRLVGFTVGSVVVSYGYDAEGRRASRTEGGTTRHSLYALGQEIAEYADGVLAARHVPGPGLDEPLATVTGAPGSRVRAWYHADAQGSVIARSDGSGAVPAGERFSYTPYGVAGSGSGSASAFRFVGRRLEPAVGLYDMRARVYAPGLGRFLQPDPIGTEGGINLYAYVRNDPLNQADPSGMGPAKQGPFDQRPVSAARSVQPLMDNQANQIGQSAVGAELDIVLAAAPKDPVTGRVLGGARTQPIPEASGGMGITRPSVDQNRLNHIFNQPRHKLDPLVNELGSQANVCSAVQAATQNAVRSRNIQGVFEIQVQIVGRVVTVRGNAVGGEARIGTFFVP